MFQWRERVMVADAAGTEALRHMHISLIHEEMKRVSPYFLQTCRRGGKWEELALGEFRV